MVEIFDFPVHPEIPFLHELAEDLEGTLHVIAHAGHEKNLAYILDRQEYFKKKYKPFFEHIHSDVGRYHILNAHDLFQELLDGNPTTKDIMQRCEEIIEEDLIGGPSEEYLEIFEEFYRRHSLDPKPFQ